MTSDQPRRVEVKDDGETVTRRARSAALVDGDIPPASAAEPGRQPEGGTSAP